MGHLKNLLPQASCDTLIPLTILREPGRRIGRTKNKLKKYTYVKKNVLFCAPAKQGGDGVAAKPKRAISTNSATETLLALPPMRPIGRGFHLHGPFKENFSNLCGRVSPA